MKLKLWSDLHLEWREHLFDHIFDPIWETDESNKETTLLLAGDIDVATMDHNFIEEVCKHFKHVLRICGNHEFYDQEYYSVLAQWREFEDGGPKNFHFLHNDWRLLDGVKFIGGTMWTSFDNGDPFVIRAAHEIMEDYNCIKHDGKPIWPAFIAAEHRKFMEFLELELAKSHAGPTVVMTHHSPGNILKRKGRMGSLTDHCYFANIEDLIGWHPEIKLWVHGHTHQNYDYMINETRVVCNPYGYWGKATNKGFDQKLILEV